MLFVWVSLILLTIFIAKINDYLYEKSLYCTFNKIVRAVWIDKLVKILKKHQILKKVEIGLVLVS